MNELSRRGFLGRTTKLAIAGAVTANILKPSSAKAEENGLTIESAISNNHGHALELTVAQLIEALREAQANQPKAVISIQGQSHPHDIELTAEEMIEIVLGGEISKASVGGSHSHDVLVKLNVG